IGTKSVKQRILDDDGKTEGHQQGIAILAVRGWANNETLQRITKPEEQRCQPYRRQIRIEAEQRVAKEGREHRSSQQRAMGKINNMQDAVDQREPERNERVNRARHQSV